ncbi:hypothetical protein [Nonomuraea jiangxiensis]|uniref:Uncharacterized protein n=1 Tax=Nonomuraea jiangxiensis TaxID=633440 RepID=A0A1G9TVZ2_9ACTN|nr:hypothetical protein [Nonomuraea jiangxiensis]SDM51843.1 hypothetical protein SAMN05421869_14626 [Nonomuraea jiangxiensis]
MGSDLRGRTADESAVHTAEFIVSSARLGELYECSALLSRTRARAGEIVDEAHALLAEAERDGDVERVLHVRDQLEQARAAYHKILVAYATLCDRITDERRAILRAQVELGRRSGLSGAA